MRILLAGVPFGCDNVGDEAILVCALAIFREAAPDAEITVSTSDPERTATRLDVATCGLLGFFDEVPYDETVRIIDAHDCFVWCGATGLSDYPQVTTELMRIAQERGKKTILWCVGMNDELTPSIHRVHPGRRKSVLLALQAGTLGLVDTIALEEGRRNRRSRRKIAQCLNAAGLLFVRDEQSRKEVLRSGVDREIIVGADSAIRLCPANLDEIRLVPGMRSELNSNRPKVGLCVSAQGAIDDERALAACIDEIIEAADVDVVGIPMNPLTDSALMARLGGRMRRRDRFSVLTGEYEPEEILAVAARMSVMISSRLHLLILASVVQVPIVGISRGSKVDNFLSLFGLKSVGSVSSCDFDALKSEVLRLLEAAPSFREQSKTVLHDGLARLELAQQQLRDFLAKS
jgi:polysaccharide pyruvyl transferase WcaK-like protein